MKNNPFLSFESITVNEPTIEKNKTSAVIEINPLSGKKTNFTLRLTYQNRIDPHYTPLLRLAFTIPLLNYGLFSKKFILKFPITTIDIDLLKKMNFIFGKDIYVNKILRRRTNYILPKYLKNLDNKFANPGTIFQPKVILKNVSIPCTPNPNVCGVLSSGGKESLLTYGLLQEIGAEVHPFYIAESGGHWRTALTAYRHHQKNDSSTQRVWTNIDRFFTYMLDQLPFIRPDHRSIRADTYPIRLCIFPFYVFSLLPLFLENKIGNLLIGSEFDDIREPPIFQGIQHYYGVYDQHQDYDLLMNNWYAKRTPGLYQWSALRQISGLIVQRILVKRYPQLAALQRSCHSCHIVKKDIIPCGICSKCQGVILFLKANQAEPTLMKFPPVILTHFEEDIDLLKLRLDEDEKNHSLYLISPEIFETAKYINHIESRHSDPIISDIELIPLQFRTKIIQILDQYTAGLSFLENGQWIPKN